MKGSITFKIATQIRFVQSGKKAIKLNFPHSKELTQKISRLSGSRFNKKKRYWIIPFCMRNIITIAELNFMLDNKLKKTYRKRLPKQAPMPRLKIPGFKGKLRKYQNVGVHEIIKRNGRVLLADEMGLGKTIEALAYLQYFPHLRPVIIVCPAALKYIWEDEIRKFMSNYDLTIVSGVKSHPDLSGDIVIINYDILYSWQKNLRLMSFKVLIADECHYFKNNKARRTKAFKLLARNIPKLLFLSGSPITNRPAEFYNALSLLNKNIFGNWRRFVERYCDLKATGFGLDYSGASNIQELHTKLTSTVMIRRLKIDVLKELPDKTKVVIPLSITNRKEYQKAELNFIKYIKKSRGQEAAERMSRAEQLAQIEVLKQLAVAGKMPQVLLWLENFLMSGEKIVVFVTHRSTLDTLHNHFKKISVVFDGRTPSKKKKQLIDDFQLNPVTKMFIGMIDKEGKPAGLGITLTAAFTTATIEYQHSPLIHDQADDRVHRISQKNAVLNYYLIAKGTIEEKLAKVLDEKLKVLKGILDGKQVKDSDLLTSLLNEYKTNKYNS